MWQDYMYRFRSEGVVVLRGGGVPITQCSDQPTDNTIFYERDALTVMHSNV